jgi:hypothetical protein
MVETIEGAPSGVLAFRAAGEVTPADYEKVLRPATAAALARGEKLRVVYVLGPEFEGFAPGAAWDDMTLGFSHLSHWGRCAVVTDRDWVEHLVKGFGWLMGPHVRLFRMDELAAAMDWAGAKHG